MHSVKTSQLMYNFIVLNKYAPSCRPQALQGAPPKSFLSDSELLTNEEFHCRRDPGAEA